MMAAMPSYHTISSDHYAANLVLAFTCRANTRLAIAIRTSMIATNHAQKLSYCNNIFARCLLSCYLHA